MLESPVKELSVVFVGDSQMSALHERFMGISGPTDVLTFPLEQDARGHVTGGEVVVCVPQARRQARLRGTRLREEALLYALHGLLHLCGYDDRTQSAYNAMHQKEDEILGLLGVGPVFHPVPARAAPGFRISNRNARAGPGKSAARRRKADGTL